MFLKLITNCYALSHVFNSMGLSLYEGLVVFQISQASCGSSTLVDDIKDVRVAVETLL